LPAYLENLHPFEARPVKYFDFQGRKVENGETQTGFFIVEYSDGTRKKLYRN
jgi:hypothetical protein